MNCNEKLVLDIVDVALLDETAWAELEKSPTNVFVSAGLGVPLRSREAFDKMVRGYLLSMELQNSISTRGTVRAANQPGGRCLACKAAVWGIAVALAGLSAAALAGLTCTSAIVVALANFSGAPAAAVLAFLTNSGIAAGGTPAFFADEICKWVRACP